MNNEFDINNIKKSDMKKLADTIEEYLINLQSVMVIPQEILEEDRKRLKNGIKNTEILIKKLRKGDISVFKDIE